MVIDGEAPPDDDLEPATLVSRKLTDRLSIRQKTDGQCYLYQDSENISPRVFTGEKMYPRNKFEDPSVARRVLGNVDFFKQLCEFYNGIIRLRQFLIVGGGAWQTLQCGSLGFGVCVRPKDVGSFFYLLGECMARQNFQAANLGELPRAQPGENEKKYADWDAAWVRDEMAVRLHTEVASERSKERVTVEKTADETAAEILARQLSKTERKVDIDYSFMERFPRYSKQFVSKMRATLGEQCELLPARLPPVDDIDFVAQPMDESLSTFVVRPLVEEVRIIRDDEGTEVALQCDSAFFDLTDAKTFVSKYYNKNVIPASRILEIFGEDAKSLQHFAEQRVKSQQLVV